MSLRGSTSVGDLPHGCNEGCIVEFVERAALLVVAASAPGAAHEEYVTGGVSLAGGSWLPVGRPVGGERVAECRGAFRPQRWQEAAGELEGVTRIGQPMEVASDPIVAAFSGCGVPGRAVAKRVEPFVRIGRKIRCGAHDRRLSRELPKDFDRRRTCVLPLPEEALRKCDRGLAIVELEARDEQCRGPGRVSALERVQRALERRTQPFVADPWATPSD